MKILEWKFGSLMLTGVGVVHLAAGLIHATIGTTDPIERMATAAAFFGLALLIKPTGDEQ